MNKKSGKSSRLVRKLWIPAVVLAGVLFLGGCSSNASGKGGNSSSSSSVASSSSSASSSSENVSTQDGMRAALSSFLEAHGYKKVDATSLKTTGKCYSSIAGNAYVNANVVYSYVSGNQNHTVAIQYDGSGWAVDDTGVLGYTEWYITSTDQFTQLPHIN